MKKTVINENLKSRTFTRSIGLVVFVILIVTIYFLLLNNSKSIRGKVISNDASSTDSSCISLNGEEKDILEGNFEVINGLTVFAVNIENGEDGNKPHVLLSVNENPLFVDKDQIQQINIGNKIYGVSASSISVNSARIKISECN